MVTVCHNQVKGGEKMSIRIRIEPIKSQKIFDDFVKCHNFEFAGMSVSDKGKKNIQHLMFIGDEPLMETITEAMKNVDMNYILYSGEVYGKFCVAAEIKYW